MNITRVVYEDSLWAQMLPLTYVRPTWELVCGQASLLEKIERRLTAKANLISKSNGNGRHGTHGGQCHLWGRPELSQTLAEERPNPINQKVSGPTLFLNGRGWWKRIPTIEDASTSLVGATGDGEQIAWVFADADLAAALTPECFLDEERLQNLLADLPRQDASDDAELFRWPWQLIHANERALISDWQEVPTGPPKHLGRLDPGSYLLAPEAVHIGAGSRIKPCAVIDAEDGPVWIGENVTISPHTSIKGPVFIGDGSLIQPGAVIHAGTTIGPVCKVGGEIEGSILQGYSNKQHDGFLGHSYIGSWVNIAADCINSDLKNTYGTVRVPINGRLVETGEMFVGMLVGDYSKLGINVSFPTGAVIGFCSSVFASQSPKFVPSFVWIDGENWTSFEEKRGIEIARKVMARRNRTFSPDREKLFRRTRRLAQQLESYPEHMGHLKSEADWFDRRADRQSPASFPTASH